MAKLTCVIVLCVFASAVVQANQCPSDNKLKHDLSLLQTKLQMKVLDDGGEDRACGTDGGVGKVSGSAKAAMLTEPKQSVLSEEAPAFELPMSVIKLLVLIASWVLLAKLGERKSKGKGCDHVPLMKDEEREALAVAEEASEVRVAPMARQESSQEVPTVKIVPVAGGEVMEPTPNDIPAPPFPPPGLWQFNPPPGLCLPSDETLESVGRLPAPESEIQTPTSTISGSNVGAAVSVDGTRRNSSTTRGQALAPSHVLSKKVDSLIKCAKRHQDADAIAIFEEIKALGWNASLQDALKRGNVFEKVALEQLAVEVFSLVVQCAGRTGQVELIDISLEDMTSAGIKMPLAFYESTMKMLVSKKCYKRAMCIGSLLEADGHKPSSVILSCIQGHVAEQLEVTLDLMRDVTPCPGPISTPLNPRAKIYATPCPEAISTPLNPRANIYVTPCPEAISTPLNPRANMFVPIATTVDSQHLQHSAEEVVSQHLQHSPEEPPPSEGSVLLLHQQGTCRPCIYACKNTCKAGSQCLYCHYSHELPKRPGKNARQKAMRRQEKLAMPEVE